MQTAIGPARIIGADNGVVAISSENGVAAWVKCIQTYQIVVERAAQYIADILDVGDDPATDGDRSLRLQSAEIGDNPRSRAGKVYIQPIPEVALLAAIDIVAIAGKQIIVARASTQCIDIGKAVIGNSVQIWIIGVDHVAGSAMRKQNVIPVSPFQNIRTPAARNIVAAHAAVQPIVTVRSCQNIIGNCAQHIFALRNAFKFTHSYPL